MHNKKSHGILIMSLFSALIVISIGNCFSQSSDNVNRGESYYKQKGYQTFLAFKFAIKTPIKLADISNQTKHDFSLEFGAIENQNNAQKLAVYQLIINRFPAGYKVLSNKEKNSFKQQMIKKHIGQNTAKKIKFGQDELEGYITQFTQKGYNAKGIIFIKNDCTYGITIISNDKLEQRFNELTNNIHFF
jgi:hypothetical protein